MRIFRKLFFAFVAFFLLGFLFQKTSFAKAPQYPISELGNCRDAQECFYYCEISRNVPTCWSYGKYILQKNVLGTTTTSPDEVAKEHGITFPVPELGNCASAQACMQFCNLTQNHQACTDFGQKHGLTQNKGNNQQPGVNDQKILSDAKTQLGCDNKDACMAFCNDPANQQKCQQFAQSEGLSTPQNNQQSHVSQTIITDAKQELGCDSPISCLNYCNSPDNFQKCQDFAQKHHFGTPQQTQESSQMQITPSQGNMQTPPCTDQASCMKWCQNNPDKCTQNNSGMMNQGSQNQYNGNMYPQQGSPYPSYGMPPSGYPIPSGYPAPMYQQGNTTLPSATGQMTPPCVNDQQCSQYCQSHQGQCPGFPQNNGGTQNGISPQPNQQGVLPNNRPPISAQPQQSSNPPQQTQSIPNNTSDQQKMCSQTAGCSWTGTTCSCSH